MLSHPPHGRPRRPGAGLVRGLARLEVQPAARGVLQVPSPPRALAALPAGRRVAEAGRPALARYSSRWRVLSSSTTHTGRPLIRLGGPPITPTGESCTLPA